jgi:hypothetical protein
MIIVHAGLHCVYGQQADGRDFHVIPSHKHATRSHWQVIKACSTNMEPLETCYLIFEFLVTINLLFELVMMTIMLLSPYDPLEITVGNILIFTNIIKKSRLT